MLFTKEVTSVPDCTGLEWGLFFAFTSPGLEETISVNDWLVPDLSGSAVPVLVFLGGDVAVIVLSGAVVAAVVLFVGVVITGLAFAGVTT